VVGKRKSKKVKWTGEYEKEVKKEDARAK